MDLLLHAGTLALLAWFLIHSALLDYFDFRERVLWRIPILGHAISSGCPWCVATWPAILYWLLTDTPIMDVAAAVWLAGTMVWAGVVLALIPPLLLGDDE